MNRGGSLPPPIPHPLFFQDEARILEPFVPLPLPPKLVVDWELASLVSEADRVLSQLAGLARAMPEAYLLSGPILRREAVASFQTDGREATLEDLLRCEVDEADARADALNIKVANCVAAMELGLRRVARGGGIDARLLKEIHARLMRGLRPGHYVPGEFRRSQSWVGPPGGGPSTARYAPPPPERVVELLDQWQAYMRAKAKEPALVQCALIHYQFEAIHPFAGDNGLVGRMLIPIFLVERQYMTLPLLAMSAYFERRKFDYERRLQLVGDLEDWRGWIEFFLRGVIEQATEAMTYVDSMARLRASYRAMLAAANSPLSSLPFLDHLINCPMVSALQISRLLRLPLTTAKLGVEQMVEMGVLSPAPNRRGAELYVAPALLAIMKSTQLGPFQRTASGFHRAMRARG
jgi:Fic family protein